MSQLPGSNVSVNAVGHGLIASPEPGITVTDAVVRAMALENMVLISRDFKDLKELTIRNYADPAYAKKQYAIFNNFCIPVSTKYFEEGRIEESEHVLCRQCNYGAYLEMQGKGACKRANFEFKGIGEINE